jgi:hypothetical protein
VITTGKRNKKKHKSKNGRAQDYRTLREEWAYAQTCGAVMPEWVPFCPTCDTDKHMSKEPYRDTGIYRCGKCQEDIVCVLDDGVETEILLSELDSEALHEVKADVRPKGTYVTYKPTELVGEGDILYVGI